MSDDDPTIVILAEHYGCVADILAERDRLRAVVDAAADGAGKTLAQVLADVMDERDRLREAQERERATADEARVARERAWLRIREIEAERDRLRAVVDALVAAAPLVPDEHGVYVNPLADALDVSPTMGDGSEAGNETVTFAVNVTAVAGGKATEIHNGTDATLAAIRRWLGETQEMVVWRQSVDNPLPCRTCGAPVRQCVERWGPCCDRCEHSVIGGVDPTSPTYDPDEYGTFTQTDGARNSPLGGTPTGDEPSDEFRRKYRKFSELPRKGSRDEQPSEDVQAGVLPGRKGDPPAVLEGDAPAVEGGDDGGSGTGPAEAPAGGEVGPRVGDGEWMDL